MIEESKFDNKMGMSGTKWKFFTVAVELFSEKGYASVSINDIANVVGIKAASMYNHFGSKDELLEQIYEFFRVNYQESLPDLDTILTSMPTTHPYEVIRRISFIYFDEEVARIMHRAIHIALEERGRDARADKLVTEVFMGTPRYYLLPILSKLIELGFVEPFDIDSFVNLVSSFNLCCAYTNSDTQSDILFAKNWWKRGIEFMMSLVHPTELAKEKFGEVDISMI